MRFQRKQETAKPEAYAFYLNRLWAELFISSAKSGLTTASYDPPIAQSVVESWS